MLRGEDSATSVSRNVMIHACETESNGRTSNSCDSGRSGLLGRSQWKEPVRIILVVLPLERREGLGECEVEESIIECCAMTFTFN